MNVLEKILYLGRKYFAVIIIPIFAILVPAYLGREQNDIQKESTPPIFFLEKIKKEDATDTIKITNEGGRATYFRFQRLTEIFIQYDEMISNLELYHPDKEELSTRTPNKEDRKVWYYIPIIDLLEEEIRTVVTEKVNSFTIGASHLLLQVEDYYELSYYDSENQYHELYYTFDQNGVGQYVERADISKDLKKIVRGGGLAISGYEKKESFYKRLEEIIAEDVLHFRWYLGREYET